MATRIETLKQQRRPPRLPPGVTSLSEFRLAKQHKAEAAAIYYKHAAQARAYAAIPTEAAAQRFRDEKLSLAKTFEKMAAQCLVGEGGAA